MASARSARSLLHALLAEAARPSAVVRRSRCFLWLSVEKFNSATGCRADARESVCCAGLNLSQSRHAAAPTFRRKATRRGRLVPHLPPLGRRVLWLFARRFATRQKGE